MTELRSMTTEQIRQEIQGLETRRYRAMMSGDVREFSNIVHPDLVYTHSDGTLDDLHSYIEKLEEEFYVYEAVEHPNDEIIVAADTAIVVGRMDARILVQGLPKELQNRALAVWVRVLGEWKLIAFQGTPSLKS